MTFPVEQYRINQRANNAVTIVPFVGKSFTNSDIENIKAWAIENGFEHSREQKVILYGDIDNIPECSYLTKSDRKSIEIRKSIDKKISDKQLSDRDIFLNSNSMQWIQTTFTQLGESNKARLSEFLDGAKEFNGLFNRSCFPILEVLNLFDPKMPISHDELSNNVKDFYLKSL